MAVDVFQSSNDVARGFGIAYWNTLGIVFPFIEDYGLNAVAYLGIFLASCFILMNGKPARVRLIDTAIVGATIILFFEIGILTFQPEFDYVEVVQAQWGTPLQWFSNVDLFGLSMCALPVLVLVRRHE
jgi:hypothetical protein